jgi:hypothetical protein
VPHAHQPTTVAGFLTGGASGVVVGGYALWMVYPLVADRAMAGSTAAWTSSGVRRLRGSPGGWARLTARLGGGGGVVGEAAGWAWRLWWAVIFAPWGTEARQVPEGYDIADVVFHEEPA